MALPKKRRLLFLFFVILLPIVSIYISFRAHQSKEKMITDQLPVLSQDSIPDFKLIAHTGDTITRKNIEGKIVVSDFFFSTCRGICPVMSGQMAYLHQYLSKNGRTKSKFVLLSHTVDPEHDSVAVLKEYAEQYGADGEMWYLLTGDKKQLYDLGIHFYKLSTIETPEDTMNPFVHSPKFTLLDREGFIRGYYDGTDSASVQQLLSDIAKIDMLDAMRSIKKDRDSKKITTEKDAQ